jgi:tetratricopeptide (TPR) repeat protein
MLSGCLLAAAGCAAGPLPEAQAREALARGLAFENIGAADDAQEAYREAARCEAVRPLALADRANVLAHQGSYAKAEKLFLESIRLSPSSPAQNNLARMYVLYGRKLGEATALALSAAEIASSPDAAADCWRTAGLAAGLNGDIPNAARHLRKGADLQMQSSPRERSGSGAIDPGMAFDLARYLLLAGQPAEALKALDQSRPPADPAQAENLSALRAAALRRIEQSPRPHGAPDR